MLRSPLIIVLLLLALLAPLSARSSTVSSQSRFWQDLLQENSLLKKKVSNAFPSGLLTDPCFDVGNKAKLPNFNITCNAKGMITGIEAAGFEISAMPATVADLTSCATLSFANNTIAELPDGFFTGPQASAGASVTVDLSDNKLRALPADNGTLRFSGITGGILTIDVAGNDLALFRSIDAGSASELQLSVARNSRLQTLPTISAASRKMTDMVIDATSCNITACPDLSKVLFALGGTRALRVTLDKNPHLELLSNSVVPYFQNGGAPLDQVEVSAVSAGLQHVPQCLVALLAVPVTNNAATLNCSPVESSRVLHLNGNSIGAPGNAVEDVNFDQLLCLTQLTLRANGIVVWPSRLERTRFPVLRTLDLVDNRFESLPPSDPFPPSPFLSNVTDGGPATVVFLGGNMQLFCPLPFWVFSLTKVSAIPTCVRCRPGLLNAPLCADVCPQGYACVDSNLTQCADGEIAPQRGAGACLPCPPGAAPDPGHRRCLVCNAGSKLNGTTCEPCAADEFCPTGTDASAPDMPDFDSLITEAQVTEMAVRETVVALPTDATLNADVRTARSYFIGIITVIVSVLAMVIIALRFIGWHKSLRRLDKFSSKHSGSPVPGPLLLRHTAWGGVLFLGVVITVVVYAAFMIFEAFEVTVVTLGATPLISEDHFEFDIELQLYNYNGACSEKDDVEVSAEGIIDGGSLLNRTLSTPLQQRQKRTSLDMGDLVSIEVNASVPRVCLVRVLPMPRAVVLERFSVRWAFSSIGASASAMRVVLRTPAYRAGSFNVAELFVGSNSSLMTGSVAEHWVRSVPILVHDSALPELERGFKWELIDLHVDRDAFGVRSALNIPSNNATLDRELGIVYELHIVHSSAAILANINRDVHWSALFASTVAVFTTVFGIVGMILARLERHCCSFLQCERIDAGEIDLSDVVAIRANGETVPLLKDDDQ